MIRQAMFGLLLTACGVEAVPADRGDETLEIAAACCSCQAAPAIYPPGSIYVGVPVEIPTDSSGGCSSYNGQAGSVSLGGHMSYGSPGLRNCQSVPMPQGGCPNTFTPEAQSISWPSE
jgi:hypothetical protein